jgi:hypothetical protein
VVRREETDWKRVGCVQPTPARPGAVRCPRLAAGELTALGKRRSRTAIIHRTIRWCTTLSGESSTTNSSLSGKEKKSMWLKFTGLSSGAPDCLVSQWRQRQRSSARSTREMWPVPTVGWVHRTVRCANQPQGATVECARYGRRSRTGQATVAVW